MAPKKTPAKLTKKDKNFYAIIGAKGGKATLKSKGKEHFSAAAILRHHGNDPGSIAPVSPKSDSLAGPRDKARRPRK